MGSTRRTWAASSAASTASKMSPYLRIALTRLGTGEVAAGPPGPSMLEQERVFVTGPQTSLAPQSFQNSLTQVRKSPLTIM